MPLLGSSFGGKLASSLSASYLDAGVSPSTTYFYRVGAVDSSGYEGALSFAARVDIPLPIQLASFNATQSGNNIVRLEWNTLSETNNYGYYIQRRASADKVFSEVSNSFVAGHGTTVIAHHYSYLDTVRTPGPWWYQLKQVDLDGAIHISEPIQSGSETGMQGVVPTSFEVLQNYPNPFNPSTLIRYGLPTKSHVTLTIYNNLGQQVASLVNEERDAGYHEATFDGSELASGVYFYRIVAGSFVQTKKLLLLR